MIVNRPQLKVQPWTGLSRLPCTLTAALNLAPEGSHLALQLSKRRRLRTKHGVHLKVQGEKKNKLPLADQQLQLFCLATLDRPPGLYYRDQGSIWGEDVESDGGRRTAVVGCRFLEGCPPPELF